MSLNETNYTSFQIKPNTKDPSTIYESRKVVFMNDAFSLDSILHITAVETLGGVNHFKFHIELERYDQENKVLTYDFNAKSEALRSQRELCRAFTATEEFAYVTPSDRSDHETV